MNQTANFQLSQWGKSDRILMEDFNSDNAKLEAALTTQRTALASKADSSALLGEINTRKTALAAEEAARKKADTDEATARSRAISTLNTAVAKLGNCQIYHTAYSGTGTTITESNPKTFTFPHQPKMMMFFGSGNKRFWAIRGMDYVFVGNYESYNLRWEGKTVSLYSTNTNLDMKDSTYYVLALLDMTQ